MIDQMTRTTCSASYLLWWLDRVQMKKHYKNNLPRDHVAPLSTTMLEIQAPNISDTSSVTAPHGLHGVLY